jgi:hypothetical protein
LSTVRRLRQADAPEIKALDWSEEPEGWLARLLSVW